MGKRLALMKRWNRAVCRAWATSSAQYRNSTWCSGKGQRTSQDTWQVSRTCSEQGLSALANTTTACTVKG